LVLASLYVNNQDDWSLGGGMMVYNPNENTLQTLPISTPIHVKLFEEKGTSF
jgi:hypothetical protein